MVRALGSSDAHAQRRALDIVAHAYRLPVVSLVARRWSLVTTDAEDLAHDFFAAAFEKGWFARYDASKGKFRTFLRACVFGYASTLHEGAERLKRGGGAQHSSIDDIEIANDRDVEWDDFFQAEWIRSVLQISLEALRADAKAHKRDVAFAIFERYDVIAAEEDSRGTYAALAESFALPVTQVTNYLAWARRRYRQHVLNTVRDLTGSEQEYNEEIRALLGDRRA